MDHLRQGIGLRGYGQKDPKQEYKKEGYEMFVQMTWRVKSAVVGNVLRLQLVRQESAEEIEQKRLAAQRRAMQRITESHAERGRRRRPEAAPEAGDHRPDAAEGRPERPVPVRLGQEVQEVPRGERGHRVGAVEERGPRTPTPLISLLSPRLVGGEAGRGGRSA